MHVYNLCHILLFICANIPNNYYLEENQHNKIKKKHKKGGQTHRMTAHAFLPIIPPYLP
nr:MAG TPA: hypothetical protein [Caudoviricetes sp.]